MQALILAGGKGTRLKPLTNNTPKPVVPFGNQPFLASLIHLLKTAGVTDIIISLNYLSSVVEEILGNGSDFGVRLSYLTEPAPRGTAGAYKFAEKLLDITTIVLNGDILTNIDLRAVVGQHKKYEATASIVLTKVENPSAYGLVEVGAESEVLRFLEKPDLNEIVRLNINTINAGIYILEPEVLSCVPAGENYSFEYQLFPDLLRRKANFRAFVSDAYWLDIGTPERYLQAHRDLLSGKIKKTPTDGKSNFEIPEDAGKNGASLIDDGCLIEPGAEILNSVLGKDVLVEKDAIVRNSVIWSGTRVGAGARILDSVVGSSCRIGKNVFLTGGSLLADDSFLNDFARY